MTHWYHLQKTKTAAAALALMLVSSSWTSVKAQISLIVFFKQKTAYEIR